jgi:putative hemolysin
MAITAEGIIILLLIIANGVFAMSEIAVVSARQARLQQRADEGDANAKAALALATQPDRFLSTVQIGITVIGTLTGAFGGATLAEELSHVLVEIPVLAPYAEALSLFLVVAAIAYLSLVIGELAPKRLGLSDPERIASLVARPMTTLSRITSPLVTLLSASTSLVIRLLGVRPSDEPPVTEDEVRIMLDVGMEAGIFEESERDIVENVFRFADRRASAMITPHTEVVWLDINDPPEANWRRILDSAHQCYPVADGNLDDVLGIVCVRDLWAQLIEQQQIDLRTVLRPAVFVPESAPALNMFTQFREKGTQGVLVLDEYGGVMGLVTLTDLLESLVGDITLASATDVPGIVPRADGSWLLDGLLPIDEFEDYFDVEATPEAEQAFQTLGGFIMHRLGRIPHTADYFEWEGLRLEVVDMDAMRVDKVLIARLEDDSTAE